MFKISRYLIADLIRKKIILAYGILLFIIVMCMFWLESNNNKALLSLMNIVLLITPLLSLLFTTIQYYNSQEFRELLLCQPIGRKVIFINEYIGISASLVLAFVIGMGLPMLIFNTGILSIYLLLIGILLTFIFSGIAYLISVLSNDKSKGIGWVLMTWFYFAILYDGILMWLLFFFSEYPLEKFTLLFTSLNPIDLSRISFLLKMEIGSLMGYSGAVFSEFLGKNIGMILIFLINIVWIIVPLIIAKRVFVKKDF